MSPDRAFDTHGRGIAISRLISFDRLEYRAVAMKSKLLSVFNP